MQHLLILFFAFITIFIGPVIVFSQPAFPGAEGFGANSIGGRGGRVIEVTNLNDSGTGSLREAVEAKGPRIIVFRVSGTIAQKTILKITNPYITIAGQTAPGGGICLKDNELVIAADQVIVRYIRSRPGDKVSKENHGFNIIAGKNIIIDHCSASWAIDETLSATTSGQLGNVTVQWCIISESLNNSFHVKGPHGYGSLIQGGWGNGYTYHHNLYADHSGRNPRPGNYNDLIKDPDGFIFDFRNNVIYNWGGRYAGYNADGSNKSNRLTRMNFVGNYYKRGYNSTDNIAFSESTTCNKAYFSGNCMNGSYPEDPWSLVLFSNFSEEQKAAYKQTVPIQVALVKPDEAIMAYKRILTDAGAVFPERDAVDSRIVNDVINGTGKIIDSQDEVGGWPELKSSTPPKDSDHDGMPDEWEIVHSLNSNDDSDARKTSLSSKYYTNIEVYINGLVANM
jgi:pectate lyase